MDSAIHCRTVTYTWPGSDAPVIDIPELDIQRGERVFLYGPSGSGKSTLLSLMAGLLTPDSGSIEVLGSALSSLGDRERDRFRARHLGFVFQQFNLIPYLDVRSNIALSASLAGLSAQETRERTHTLLEALLLDTRFLHQRADQLSIGQQQRVAVARAMIKQPELLIADEPTSSLDEEARNEFIDLMLKTQEQTGSTVLFVSHDRSLMQHFDRHLSMNEINAANRSVHAA